MESSKKPKARDLYREFAEQFCSSEFGKLTKTQLGITLTRFYIETVHNRTVDETLDEEDIGFALVDGSADLGVDLIHRDNGTVYIYQSKYFSRGTGPTRTDVSDFQGLFDRLRAPKYRKNARLRDQLLDVDWGSDRFVLKFICLGKIQGDSLVQTTEPVRPPVGVDEFNERLDVEYLDESALDNAIRNARSQEAGIPTQVVLTAGTRGARAAVIELDESDHRSCVLVVGANQIVGMFQQERESLFTYNIRNYIGNTATNKAIKKTAKTRPSDFFHFNNGISCLAKSMVIDHATGQVITHGIQVINGAQTVKALASAAEGGSLDPSIRVLMRITEVPNGYGPDHRFAEEITRSNNTQNVIKHSDFRSNDSVQRDLVKRFGEIRRRRGKPVQYLPKRTDNPKAQHWIIRLEEFAKVCYSFLADPVKFSGSTLYLYNTEPSGGYVHVFGDGSEVWEIMPMNEFRLRAAIWWMAEAFAEQLKLDKASTSDSTVIGALERKWFLIYTARLVLARAAGEEAYRGMLSKYWEGDWIFGEGKVGNMFKSLYEHSKAALIYIYGEAKDAEPRPGEKPFSHRNWMRSMDSVRALERYVNRAMTLRDWLVT